MRLFKDIDDDVKFCLWTIMVHADKEMKGDEEQQWDEKKTNNNSEEVDWMKWKESRQNWTKEIYFCFAFSHSPY